MMNPNHIARRCSPDIRCHRRGFWRLAKLGEDPMEFVATSCHLAGMRTLLSLVMLPFFFAGSGFCLAGLIGGLTGLILLICLFLHFTGGFRTKI
ncbi:MAG TPA: hypothetical protein VIK35_07425 [Verrucomicrobiae bacterium]